MVRTMKSQGKSVRAVKPVISGWDDDPAAVAASDTGILLAAQGLDLSPENIEACSPYRFKAPLSPDMAAAREGTGDNGTLLIEGVGGVMVPLTEDKTVLDWMAALSLPVVLVTGSYLGTISHTLTAALALREKHISIRSIVISESEESPVPCEETAEALIRHLGPTPIRIAARER